MADRFLDFPAGSFGAGVAFWHEVAGSTLSPVRGGDSVRLDGAGASRADQFWLDAPASEVERERSFWTALTGWQAQDGGRSALPVRLGSNLL